jgi:uncharacterized lipoprotein YajG
MKPLIACAALMLLAGCSVPPTMEMSGDEKAASATNADWSIERVAVFRDTLAYDNRRAIYILTNAHTGKQYVGVSGIGISEMGSHNCGKSCITEDER